MLVGEDSSQSLVAGSEVGNSQVVRHVGAKRLGVRGEQLDSRLCTLFPPRRCGVAEIERQRPSLHQAQCHTPPLAASRALRPRRHELAESPIGPVAALDLTRRTFE